ncbi:MAG: T9SS type A sorting domain-containing protein [Bacteroidetes bacterium]|nr:T9SS type A sorting domain-containing protein [Bacteroidota bacterium]
MDVLFRNTALLLFAFIFSFCLTANAQPWTFTGPGDWDDASKWSPGYPGLNIGFSSVTINGDCNLENNTVNFSSGGGLEINGSLTATGGTLNFTQGILINNGSIVHAGAGGLTFSMPGGGSINNTGAGTLTFNADFFCGGAISNAGQMNVNAVVSNAMLDNSGTVTGNGTLSFGGNSINSGTLGSAGMVIEKPSTSSFTNSGTLHFYHNFNLSSGNVSHNSGTLTVHPGATFNVNNSSFFLNGGTLNVNGIFSINSSNTVSPAGACIIAVGNGGAFRVNDGSYFYLTSGVIFNNAGTVAATSGTGIFQFDGGTFNNTGSLAHNSAVLTLNLNSGALNNNTGGTVDLLTGLTMPGGFALSNAATLNLHNAASLIVPVNAVLTNTGSVGVAMGQTGTLNIQSGGTVNNAGTIEHGGAPALTVQLNGTFNNVSGGLFKLSTNASFTVGTFNNNTGANLNLNGQTLTLSTGSTLNQASGSLSGNGTLSVADGTLNNSGTLSNTATTLALSAGNLNNLAGGTLTIQNALTTTGGAIANAGTLNSNAALTVNGTLSNNTGGTLNLNATLTMNNGNLSNNTGGTLNLNALLQMTGAAAVLNLGGIFSPNNGLLGINQATVNLSANMTVSLSGGGTVIDLDFPQGTINVQNAATLTLDEDFLFGIQVVNVEAGGTLVIPTGKSLTIINTSVLNNLGTLTLGGTMTIGAANSFTLGGASATNVSGILDLNAGTLAPASGATLSVSSGGAFRVNDGAAFALGSGVVFNNAGTVGSTSGTGTFSIEGGTLNNTGNLTHSSQLTLALTGGTLNNNSGGVLDFSQNFTYDSGTLNNNSGGQLTASQPFTIASGRTLTSAGTLTNSGGIVNNGTLLQTGGEVFNNGDLSGSGTLTVNGGTFQNADDLTGQAITVAGATSVFNNNSGLLIFSANSTISGGGIFENKTGGTFHIVNCTVQVSGGSTLTHRGAIACNNGTLLLYGVLNNHAPDLRHQTGVLNIAGENGSAIHNYGTLTIHSTFWATNGTVNNYAGAIFSIENASAFFRGPTVNDGAFVSTTGGRIQLGANFLNNGTITNNGFTLGQFYTFTNTGTCTFVDQLDFFSNFVNAIVNSGTLTLNGSFANITPGSGYTILTNTGTINTNGNFTSHFQLNITNSNIFNQNGFLTFFHGNSSFQVDGTLNIAAGKALHIECALKGSGTINNTGQLYTPAGATLRPGTSPGTLTVSHDYDLTAAAYHCEINGTTPGTQHDVLAISGAATLSSASLVVNWGSFTPTGGETFDIMTFGSRTGTFASVTIPPVSGISFTVSYTSTKVTLNALVLPVELVDFQAFAEGEMVRLEWATASETNNQGFEVQRSSDGAAWEMLGFVAGNGTTTAAHDYSFLDEKPLPGMNYYRLRQVDFDGGEEFSKVVSADFRNLQDFGNLRAFPNPVSDGGLTLLLPENTEEEITVSLFTPAGQLVRSMTVGSGTNALDVSGLAAGVYTLQVWSGTRRFFEKIIVQ